MPTKRALLFLLIVLIPVLLQAQAISPTYSKAEIYLARVNDTMRVQVNSQPADFRELGTTAYWIDITDQLHDGENTVHVEIGNGGGGECGGELILRFDGDDSKRRSWLWHRTWAVHDKPCVNENVTLWQYETLPPGFHVVEIQSSAVDDSFALTINNQPVDGAHLGYTRPWVDVSKYVHEGRNTLHVLVRNDHGGECGAALAMRIDGKLRATPWRWHKVRGGSVCFDEDVKFRLP
jgi:hypothetical protein